MATATAIRVESRAKGWLVGSVLEGNVTTMRPVAADDLPIMALWDSDPAIIAVMGRKYEQTSAEEWLQELTVARNCRAWAIETKAGRLVGELELAQVNRRAGTAELRICIGEKDCWNQGLGSDALRQALQFAFGPFGLRQVYLRVYASNQRAIHVYQRMGFRKEAMLQPCAYRQDPSPIILMSLTADRWAGQTEPDA